MAVKTIGKPTGRFFFGFLGFLFGFLGFTFTSLILFAILSRAF